MEAYYTVQNAAEAAFVEKKSRFIGHCRPVQTEAEALAFIAEIKKKHWDATHNVSAFILRGGLKRFSDDGEPQGKAGIPVLDAMEKNGVEDAVVVATRYFGGIMLGGGGLIRAYSKTAAMAVAAAKKILMKSCGLMTLHCDYNAYGRVSAVIFAAGAVLDETRFLEDVQLCFHIAPENSSLLQKQLADATNGRVQAVETGKAYFAFPVEQQEAHKV